MPQYAICRIKKIKSAAGVKSMSDHNERTRETPNANLEVTNYDLRSFDQNDGANLYENVMNKLPEKRRSNAVLAVEHVLTASPEFFENMTKTDVLTWAESSQHWLNERYGKENVAYSTLHLDEKTPHIHAVIVPLVDGKLNAREIFGTREKMRDMQDSYHERVKFMGLERGIKGSKAKHVDIQKFYNALENPNFIKEIKAKQPQKKNALDISYDKRLIEWYQDEVLPIADLNIKALRQITSNSTKPLKGEIDVWRDHSVGLSKNIESLAEEKKTLERNVRRLEKSLCDSESLTKRQEKYMSNVVDHLANFWNKDRNTVVEKMNTWHKQRQDKDKKKEINQGRSIDL